MLDALRDANGVERMLDLLDVNVLIALALVAQRPPNVNTPLRRSLLGRYSGTTPTLAAMAAKASGGSCFSTCSRTAMDSLHAVAWFSSNQPLTTEV